MVEGSILSKKIAESPAALVLDVKLGKGATISDENYMRKLAHTLVSVANLQGVKTTAVLSRMDSPIGSMIGNALEIAEVIECLHGGGPRHLVNLIEQLGGYVIYNVGRASTPQDGALILREVLQDGRAMAKFRALLMAQGVNGDVVGSLCAVGGDPFTVLPRASSKTTVTAAQTGYIVEVDALVCAQFSMSLGAGRRNAQDILDHAVGIQMNRHVGDYVTAGDVVFTIHHSGLLTSDAVAVLQCAVKVDAVCPDDRFINDLVVEVFNC